MRADAIRTFPACYQAGASRESPLTGLRLPCAVASARAFLAILGLGFAIAGLAVAWTFDRLIGIGVLLIGAFLLVMPFTRSGEDE